MLTKLNLELCSNINRKLDDIITFDYNGMEFVCTKAINNFDVCINITVDGINMMYNNPVTPDDITIWLKLVRLAFKFESKVYDDNRAVVMRNLKRVGAL